MNELKLLLADKERIIYSYQPNGNSGAGEVMYDFRTGEAVTTKVAPDDEDGYYSHKACKKLDECVKKNNLPIKFVQAWY